MAVETGAIFNSIVFGGVNSADYGIYVTGDAVYDVPKRATKLVSVPGRNGAVAIDQGYWENIELTYPAGVFGDDQQDFAEAIRAYRNAVASKIGYQRLTDTYHPREFRMAMFIDGMEVDPKSYGRAGQFSLKFECKPQRWLTSGETTVTVASGDVLTNPTLYGASPLLAVDGTGTVNLGEQAITVQERELGTVIVRPGDSYIVGGDSAAKYKSNITIDTTNLNSGDTITLGAFKITETNSSPRQTTITMTDDSQLNGATITWKDGANATKWTNVPAEEYVFGTSKTVVHRALLKIEVNGSSITTYYGAGIVYDGNSTFEVTYSGGPSSTVTFQLDDTVAYSTKMVNDTAYIDLDVGEAYWIQDGKPLDANNLVSLGSDLPVLEPGENAITYDSTITGLTIKPRWWQL